MKLNTISSEFTEKITTEKEARHKTASLPEVDSSDKLDGGYGWWIVLASFLMQACSFGVIAGFGVFLKQYHSQLFPDQPISQVSLIGTVAPTTIALASIFTGRLCDVFGFRTCSLLGWGLIVISYVSASFATKIWHFIFTQGILFGLGGALVYVPANTIVTQWFVKYRGLAVGIGTAGSGFGGSVTGIANAPLFSKLSIPWVLRINGLIIGIALLVSSLIIKSPRANSVAKDYSSSSSQPKCFHVSMIFTPKFLLFSLSMLFGGFGYLVPLYYLPIYAEHVGLTEDQGGFLVGAVNIASAVGRIILGFMGDRLGHARMFFLCLLGSCLLPIIWLFSKSFGVLMFFSIVYGLASGGFAGGFPATCAALFGEMHLATLMGIAYAPTGLGDLFGPYLAGLILDTSHNYNYIIYYAMGLYGMAALCMLLILISPTKNISCSFESSLSSI